MRKELIDLIEGRLRDTDAILTSATKDQRGKPYPTRTIFIKAQKYIKDHLRGDSGAPRWLIIPGLRGVGKSTLLAQLYTRFPPEGIRKIYFALDDIVKVVGSNLNETLQAYEALTGINLATDNVPTVLFLDEVHYDSNWASVLKVMYDKNPKLFIFCTGSSAIALQTKTDEVRRISVERLYPSSFAEYALIKYDKYPTKGLKAELSDALWRQSTAIGSYSLLKHLEKKVDNWWADVRKDAFDHYMISGSIPFASVDPDINRALMSVYRTIESITKIDLPEFKTGFQKETLDSTMNLLWLLASSGDTSLRSLAEVTRQNNRTIMEILDALVKTELIIRFHPYVPAAHKKDPMMKPTRPSKYLFMSPTMRASILHAAGGHKLIEEKWGLLLEDVAGMYFYKEHMNRGMEVMSYKDDVEASSDFLLTRRGETVIPIEVGTGSKDCVQVKSMLQKFTNSAYGIVICSKTELSIVEDKIVKVPLKFFLLA